MADTSVDAIRYLRDTAIAAGTDLGEKIYMSIAPQNVEPPFAVMEIISRVPSPTQDSGSAVDTFRFQVDVFAKATDTQSAAEIAHQVAGDLRAAWSRGSDELNYTNQIDSVQEDSHRTDFLDDLKLYQVSNDYMIRVKPNGEVITRQYSLSEQVWPYARWLNDEIIYWRTWYFDQGSESRIELTGLPVTDRTIIRAEMRLFGFASNAINVLGAELFQNTNDDVYEIEQTTENTDIYITVWYTKD